MGVGSSRAGRSPRPTAGLANREHSRRLIRPNAFFLAVAVLVAITATVFGVLAVPSEHHWGAGAEHEEYASPVAAHEGEEETRVLDAGEALAALAASILAIALVPIGIRTSCLPEPADMLRFAVAVALAGAATIHFAVIDQHFGEYWLFGVFFVAVALAQLGWVVAVVSRPTRTLYVVGALGNALIALTWLVSRTRGLPLGPEAGHPEPIGLADAASTAFELMVVVGTVLLLRGVVLRNSRDSGIAQPLIAVTSMAVTALALASL